MRDQSDVLMRQEQVIGPPLQEISSLQSLNVSASELYGVFCGTVEAKARGRVWVDARDIALAHVRAIVRA